MDTVAKHCKNLECIDIYGLKMSRGYRAEQEATGPWASIVGSCPKLVHLRTFQMTDREFGAVVAAIPITDISAVYGMKGDHFNTVSPALGRCAFLRSKNLDFRG